MIWCFWKYVKQWGRYKTLLNIILLYESKTQRSTPPISGFSAIAGLPLRKFLILSDKSAKGSINRNFSGIYRAWRKNPRSYNWGCRGADWIVNPWVAKIRSFEMNIQYGVFFLCYKYSFWRKKILLGRIWFFHVKEKLILFNKFFI